MMTNQIIYIFFIVVVIFTKPFKDIHTKFSTLFLQMQIIQIIYWIIFCLFSLIFFHNIYFIFNIFRHIANFNHFLGDLSCINRKIIIHFYKKMHLSTRHLNILRKIQALTELKYILKPSPDDDKPGYIFFYCCCNIHKAFQEHTYKIF